ncbi:MAG: hypothetical protein ACK559_40575 [bacterium]
MAWTCPGSRQPRSGIVPHGFAASRHAGIGQSRRDRRPLDCHPRTPGR